MLGKIFAYLRIFVAEAIATGLLCFPFMVLDPDFKETLLLLGFAVAFGIFCGVFISGPISGGHINPAVTLTMVVTRRLHPLMAPLYILAQLIGSIMSCLVARECSPFANATFNDLGMTHPAAGVTLGQAIGLELVMTFGLVLGILSIIDELKKKSPFGMAYGGLPVACYVAFFHVFDVCLAGPITGGSMNPARSLGPALINLNFGAQYIYVVGPICGGIIAGILYEFILSEGAGLERSRAFFSRGFDRECDYRKPEVGDERGTYILIATTNTPPSPQVHHYSKSNK